MNTKYEPVADLHKKMYGHRPCRGSVSRWLNVGRKVRGQIRFLRVVRINNRPYTTPEWLAAFKEDGAEPVTVERGPTTAQLEKAQSAAEQFLAAEGI